MRTAYSLLELERMVGEFFPMRRLKHGGHLVRYLAAGCLAVVLATAGCDAHNSPAAGPGGGSAIGAAPATKTQICGQPILNSPYKYDGYRGSSLTAFASGEQGLPTYGSAGSDYPQATAGYTVPPGDNSKISADKLNTAHVLIYFEPGDHLNLNNIEPGNDSVFIGGYAPRSGEADDRQRGQSR